MTTQTPQQIGDSNQRARDAAARTLEKFKGEQVSRLTPIEQKEILMADARASIK
jgi:hypothetical protein